MPFMYDAATQYFYCGEYPTTEQYHECKANISKVRERFDKFDFYIVYSIIKNNKVTFGYSFSLSTVRLAAVREAIASINNNVFGLKLSYFDPDCYFNNVIRVEIVIYGLDEMYLPTPVYSKLVKFTPLQTDFSF